VLANVVDVEQFDRQASGRLLGIKKEYDVLAVAVARLVPAKRLDRFLRALARARRAEKSLRGLIVGDGPERPRLEALAAALGLLPYGVRFFGACANVPSVLARADMLVLTSQHEGFPNVLLEGMAARLPVITTPAGDAGMLVDEGRTGFIVPFHDQELLAERMLVLARSPAMRGLFGACGRSLVEAQYRVDALAERQRRGKTLRAVDALAR
jgi:glycosyltransferase involved in cell wall biosynthesis